MDVTCGDFADDGVVYADRICAIVHWNVCGRVIDVYAVGMARKIFATKNDGTYIGNNNYLVWYNHNYASHCCNRGCLYGDVTTHKILA